MRILVVDDELPTLTYLSACLEPLGHSVQTFDAPLAALASLKPDVDLVIVDVAMPEMDGFMVAAHVAEALGSSPPRTLLISGNAHKERLESTSPAKILGLLAKPFIPSELNRVLRFLALTRTRCPGSIAPLCAHTAHRDPVLSAECSRDGNSAALCGSPDYSGCQHYDTVCGKRLREWIAMMAGGAAWDKM
jgi:CheY-like chemotaxis protein